jgi:hypothetical protein
MKKLTAIGIFLLNFCLVSALSAGERTQWEFWSGPLVDLSFASKDTYFRVLNQQDQMIRPSVGYLVREKIELKLTPNYFYDSKTNYSVSELDLLLGVNYSFYGAFEDAFFVEGQIGIARSTVSVNSVSRTNTNLAFLVSGGKRFQIISHLHYAPAVTFFYKDQDAPAKSVSTFSFIPVQFTISI